MMLRRVWNSLRKGPYSSQTEEDWEEGISVSRADELSDDVRNLIWMRLSPRDCAMAAAVCRTWRDSVDDGRLWRDFLMEECGDTWPVALFAETYLREGPLHQSVVSNMQPLLPFRKIYSQRTQLQGSIILDGGSGYCKYGRSENLKPTDRSATFLEFANIESPIYSRLKYFFSTIFSRLQVKPSAQPLVLSMPICHCDDTQSAKAARWQLRESIYHILFDMNVPAVCAIDQAVLALYAAQQTSGIVVNIGFQITSVVPILRGKVMRNVGVELVGQGALRLTGYLSELMRSNGIGFDNMSTVRTLKENLCYVAEDYYAELLKNTEASFSVGNEGEFTLSHERFQTTEILFQPQLGGIRAMGLHRAVALCIDHCEALEVQKADEGWFKTVVLAGGSACLPGLAERLKKELLQALPSSILEGIKVLPPPYGAHSAWIGAKILSNMSTFPQLWCITKKQFRRYGPSCIHAMALDDE